MGFVYAFKVMIELSGGSAFFAKLWSAKGGREGGARPRKEKKRKNVQTKTAEKEGENAGRYHYR